MRVQKASGSSPNVSPENQSRQEKKSHGRKADCGASCLSKAEASTTNAPSEEELERPEISRHKLRVPHSFREGFDACGSERKETGEGEAVSSPNEDKEWFDFGFS